MAKNNLVLEFSHSLYSPPAIKAAAMAYSKIFNCKLERGLSSTRVVFENGCAHIQAKEFANYALFLSIQKNG